MSKYIYSTLSSDNDIVIYGKNGDDKPIKTAKVTIFGKANIANKKTLITPKGVLTVLEDKEYDLIKDDFSFKKWIEKGYITVETKASDADNVAKNMTSKDKSAQKQSEDYQGLKAEILDDKDK